MVKTPSPPLLPILRSRQQADLLTAVLGNPETESSITELADRLGIAYASAHREIGRAERAGLVTSRKVGNTRLVRADVDSPYYDGLADVLGKAFGPPQVVAETMAEVAGAARVFVFGSWTARYSGRSGARAVGDIDVLVLGVPDRDAVYRVAAEAGQRLGRDVQVTIRPDDWLETGEGSFHATVTSRPLLQVIPERRLIHPRNG